MLNFTPFLSCFHLFLLYIMMLHMIFFLYFADYLSKSKIPRFRGKYEDYAQKELLLGPDQLKRPK